MVAHSKYKAIYAYMLQICYYLGEMFGRMLFCLLNGGYLKDTDNTFLEKMLEGLVLKNLKMLIRRIIRWHEAARSVNKNMANERFSYAFRRAIWALDRINTNHMQDWLTKVWEKHQRQCFSYHDIEEAIYLSDGLL